MEQRTLRADLHRLRKWAMQDHIAPIWGGVAAAAGVYLTIALTICVFG